jgi:hypothetical protein
MEFHGNGPIQGIPWNLEESMTATYILWRNPCSRRIPRNSMEYQWRNGNLARGEFHGIPWSQGILQKLVWNSKVLMHQDAAAAGTQMHPAAAYPGK